MLSHPFQVSEVIIEFSSFSPSNLFTHHLETDRDGDRGDREGDMFVMLI